MGLNLAEPVPARVPGHTKEGLLKLIDDAVAGGWAHTRACVLLGVADVRAHRWRARLHDVGSLEDRAPGGNPVHRLLGWEEDAILQLIEEWGQVDRSHRKLAYRGSYVGTVFVSPSSLRRVAEKCQVELPEPPPRKRATFALPWPETIQWRPNQIWMWDGTKFRRCHWSCLAIVDVVSRYWIGHLLTPS